MDTAAQPPKTSFAPVVDSITRVVILGSLPGEVSLSRAEYYAHSRNQFWRLIQAASGQDLPERYEDRLRWLKALGVGLWDTVKSARRVGSLDTAIRDHQANPLPDFIASLPALQAVAFNGGKAAKLGRAQLAADAAVKLINLPSSSPAYTMSFERKLERWLQLRDYLRL